MKIAILVTIAATAVITFAVPAAEEDLSVRAIGRKCNHGNVYMPWAFAFFCIGILLTVT